MLLLLPKLETQARAIRVSTMEQARAHAARARAVRARRAMEELEARRRQATEELERARVLEEHRRRRAEAEQLERLEREKEEKKRLAQARWRSVQSVDLELIAPHGLWAAGEDLLVDKRPLQLRVRIRDHRGDYPSTHSSPCIHPSVIYHPVQPSLRPRTHEQVLPLALRCR